MTDQIPLDRREMLFLSGFALVESIAGPIQAVADDGKEEPRPTQRLRLQGKALDCIEAVAFSADRKALATAHSDGAIKLWDLSNGRERNSLKDEATDVG